MSPAKAAGPDFGAISAWIGSFFGAEKPTPTSPMERIVKRDNRFVISKSDWETFEFAEVLSGLFRDEIITEARLAIDETSATPVISPYSGRAVRIHAQAGDQVTKGQPLFSLEAQEMVQAQNDFVAALSALEKAMTQLQLAEVNAKRQQDLFTGRAAPQRDLDQARADLEAARADWRAATTGLDAVENRLRIIGKTEQELARFREGRRINAEIAIPAPIDGTVVSRKIGIGQFIQSGAAEPVFVIDDLNTLWLNAMVREDDAGRVRRGAAIEFKVMAFPTRVFRATVDYVAASIDADSRRLLVRATVDNADFSLKQQMFANVSIQVGDPMVSSAIPRTSVIHEGATTRVWVANPADFSVELRRVQLGLIKGGLVQVTEGLSPGERVVSRGALFVDQMTAALRR
jgi:cobalt-zinc-cadmium efflux system membrane fusion protein